MAISTLLEFLQLYAAVIIIGVGLLAIVVFLFTQNKILFFSLIGAVGLHVLLILGVWIAGTMMKETVKPEKRIEVKILKTVEPEKEKVEPPKLEEKKLDLPLGQLKTKTNSKIMPKGKRLDSNVQKQNTAHVVTQNSATEAEQFSNYDDRISTSVNDNLNTKEIYESISKLASEGTPDGEGTGEVPAGFPDGKVGGRVYFISLKWGGANSGWRANSDGLVRLLSFVNQSVPCQSDTWPMTAAEIRMKYTSKNQVPSFLYVFCDESFQLSSVDATVLRDYINKGGFLFMDSRDESIKDKVSRELEKVTSGKLSPIANSNSINSFLYRLSSPGIGLNPGAKNYGISRGGRLVVFYTPGNFSYVYANYKASEDEYFKAQYQMGANVIMYAIRKGDSSGITKQKGASATLTKSVIDKITGGDQPVQPIPGATEKVESVKVKPVPPVDNPGGTPVSNPPDVPEDIIIE